jgi:hypothetical protein
MKLVVSDAAVDLIRERGGQLYVWTKKGRCCGGGATRLETSSELPARREFRNVVTGGERFELFVPSELSLPDELHLDVRRFPRRVEAYWNGCAWVV